MSNPYHKTPGATFYDRIAKKFGGYRSQAKNSDEFPDGNPEATFKQHLVELSGKDKTALDVGCADGRFTLSVADHFKRIVAIDISKGMLKAAKKFQQKSGIANVTFFERDLHSLSDDTGAFDVVYCRRGPTDYPLFHIVLKPGGFYLEIGIGEKDAQALKEVFGRGQNFGNWNESTLEKDKAILKALGFEFLYSRDFFYNEYYPTYEDIDLFLQGVPIFEDYDPVKDKAFMEAYTRPHSSDKGIRLERHRIVIVARKL